MRSSAATRAAVARAKAALAVAAVWSPAVKASFAVVSSAAPSGRRSAVAPGEARRSVTAVLALGDGDAADGSAADGATVGGHPSDGHGLTSTRRCGRRPVCGGPASPS
ncbi:hypothetical protein [Streptomyces sp. NPDC052610]|uniref:hypothetical protein n=1 Tax=Streptomyces sp. NPDC052610 TaxID=3154952 RepID=UPI0034207909